MDVSPVPKFRLPGIDFDDAELGTHGIHGILDVAPRSQQAAPGAIFGSSTDFWDMSDIGWFRFAPSNYSYKYHKPQLLEL